MSLSTFVVRIIFLALPGILASKVYRKLRGPTDKEQWESVIEIGLFSVASYLLLIPAVKHFPSLGQPVDAPTVAPAAVAATIPKPTANPAGPKPTVYAVEAFLDESLPIPIKQVALALFVAMPVALLAGYIHNFKVVTFCGRLLRATGRMADEDVWELFFTAKKTKWILLRDHKYCLAYYGLARFYSDSDRDRELVLENVTVYNNDTAAMLYSVPTMYLCRSKEELTVELPESVTPARKPKELEHGGGIQKPEPAV
jgi:hypothetical protein